MTERTILIILIVLYLCMFITRNIIVRKRTGQSIRKAGGLVGLAILLTTFCFTATLLSTSDKFYQFMGIIASLRNYVIIYIGFGMFLMSIILCWIFSSHLKDSWRVGVHDDQKTVLIKDGIYGYIRNPYFLSYFIMYVGLFFIRPSIVLFMLIIMTVMIFHQMVLKEEAYLLKVHGKEYEDYKVKAGRYLPRFI